MEAARLGRADRSSTGGAPSADDAFVGHRPVYQELADEITELVGSKVYDRFVALLRRAGPAAPARVWPLPHPAVRRRSDTETASVGAVEVKVEVRAVARAVAAQPIG